LVGYFILLIFVSYKNQLNMKATFNIKTREFIVKGKDIETLQVIIPKNDDDYWETLYDKKTDEPIFDVNIFFDDYANDGGDINNPKNYQAQYVKLIEDKHNEGYLTNDSNYQTLKLKVIGGEFNPIGATWYLTDKNGSKLLKTKSMSKISDYITINNLKKSNVSLYGIDKFGNKKFV